MTEKNLYNLGIFAFLVLISIGNLSTTEISREVIIVVRYLAMGLTITSMTGLLLCKSIYTHQLLTVYIFILFLVWGSFLAVLSGSASIGLTTLLVDSIVIFTGIVLLGYRQSNVIPVSVCIWIIYYVLLGLVLSIVAGGLELDFPPQFIFSGIEFAGTEPGSQAIYSHGISQFFGLGAIAAAYVLVNSTCAIQHLMLILAVIIFLSLSLLGGARGDSIASVVVLFFYLLSMRPVKVITTSLLVTIGLIVFVNDWSTLENFTIFNRINDVFRGDLGIRDLLLEQALNLISEESRCLVFGCGFGYFQHYYNYSFGMYPHNFIAELVIVFGLPVAALFVITALGGFFVYLNKSKRLDFFILILIYYAIIGLKSGSLLGGWWLSVGSFYLMAIFYNSLNLAKKGREIPAMT